MSEAPSSLRRLQVWIQGLITQPAGPLAAATTEEVAAVILPSAEATSAERLEIYHRAYFARLLECLRSQFPAMVALLGEEAFDGLGLTYLQQHPPHSYTLGSLADRFIDFLQATRPERAGEAVDQFDFVIELARLEQAIDEVFDGPGTEGQPAWSEESLFAGQAADDVRLRLAPSVRLLAFSFPVNDFYTRYRRGEELAIPQPEETYLALHRREYVVQRYQLVKEQYHVLKRIEEGQSLGDALDGCEAKAMEVEIWFQDWGAAGIVTA